MILQHVAGLIGTKPQKQSAKKVSRLFRTARLAKRLPSRLTAALINALLLGLGFGVVTA
jgi:hypothetical protein